MRDELIERVLYFLNEYYDVACSSCVRNSGDPIDDIWAAEIDELIPLIDEVEELRGAWQKKREFGDANTAAAIVYEMIHDWGLLGAVWFNAVNSRFRLCGEGYEPEEAEQLVGMYLPSVTQEMLAEDFDEVLRQVAYVEGNKQGLADDPGVA